jgi:hypothetical protein
MQYLINRADGGISIADTDKPEMVFAKWAETADPKWLPATIEPLTAPLPEDRTFRDAWVKTEAGIEVGLDKAKAVFGQRLAVAKRRKARELMEREFAGEDISAEKAALQAPGPDVSQAQNTDELKALWPEGL